MCCYKEKITKKFETFVTMLDQHLLKQHNVYPLYGIKGKKSRDLVIGKRDNGGIKKWILLFSWK